MTVPSMLEEPSRVDEPGAALGYSAVFTQVAAEHRPLIVCRNGEDFAAVIPLEHLELLREALARQEVEQLAAQINWDQPQNTPQLPPQAWFDDDDNPFEPEKEPAP